MPPSSDQDRRDVTRSDSALSTLRFSLAVDWVSPSLARERVRTWLRQLGWSPSHIDDLTIVISEAVSNSIEHGHGLAPESPPPDPLAHRPVDVSCRVVADAPGERRVEFTIRDYGAWLPARDGPTTRGKGFNLMRACTDRLDVRRERTGTTVVALSRPIPVRLTAF